VARNDPTETGGLFVRRSSEVRGVRYRGSPQRKGGARQSVDRGASYGLLAIETLLCLSIFGPQPWFATIMAGTLASLLLTVMVAKRVDNAWKLVRRAAGYKQERGALEAIFAVTVAVAVVIFSFWFFIVEGPGPSIAPQ
jgi:hypothetical protein